LCIPSSGVEPNPFTSYLWYVIIVWLLPLDLFSCFSVSSA
jgi:hypothetical protein